MPTNPPFHPPQWHHRKNILTHAVCSLHKHGSSRDWTDFFEEMEHSLVDLSGEGGATDPIQETSYPEAPPINATDYS